ncbi:hypothetical protein ACWD4G_26335 [Streptomyces sp. NPDC002643]
MSMNEHAVALRFTDRAAAYQAFGDLTRLSSDTAEVRGAVLVERVEDGTVRVPAVLETEPGRNTAVGGLVGSLMDILGGPLGPVMGWGIGAVIGGGYGHRQAPEAAEATEIASAVGAFTPHVPPGGTALLAEVGESDTEALNLLAMTYGAVLERRPADTVRAELKAMAEDAELIRKRQAKARRDRKRAEAAKRSGWRGVSVNVGATPQLAA